MTLNRNLEQKQAFLNDFLKKQGRLAVAYSGGVDSVFLVKAATLALSPENVLALTVDAANFTADEFTLAGNLAREWGVRQIILPWDPLSVPEFVENGHERCYFCKKALFGLLLDRARAMGFSLLADGANLDDETDYRPGQRAARELGVLSPLKEAGFNKDEIHTLLRHYNVPGWDRPANACLASRVPFGQIIDAATLARIAASETFFRYRGLMSVRVRSHGELARVELSLADRDKFIAANLWEDAERHLLGQGYRFAAMDFGGYKKGNLNS